MLFRFYFICVLILYYSYFLIFTLMFILYYFHFLFCPFLFHFYFYTAVRGKYPPQFL